MKRSNNKGFTTAELVTIIVAVVVVLAVLIPTILIVNNKNSELAEMQEKTNQQIADLSTKLEGVSEGLSAEDVQKLLNDALATLEIPESGLSEAQVKDIIDAAIDGIQIPSGLTSAQVKQIVSNALKGINTGLSKNEIEDIINGILKDQETAVEDIETALKNGKSVTMSADHVLKGSVYVPANSVLTLDLNGKTLTIPTNTKFVVNGNLQIVGGDIVVEATYDEWHHDMGLIVKAGGHLTMKNVNVDVTETGVFCVANHTDGIVDIIGGTFRVTGYNEKIGKQFPIYNNGKMTVTDTTIINDKHDGDWFYAAIVNYKDLTLNNVTVNTLGTCVYTGNEGAVTTVIGGNFVSASGVKFDTRYGGELIQK